MPGPAIAGAENALQAAIRRMEGECYSSREIRETIGMSEPVAMYASTPDLASLRPDARPGRLRCFDARCLARADCPLWLRREIGPGVFAATWRQGWEHPDQLCLKAWQEIRQAYDGASIGPTEDDRNA